MTRWHHATSMLIVVCLLTAFTTACTQSSKPHRSAAPHLSRAHRPSGRTRQRRLAQRKHLGTCPQLFDYTSAAKQVWGEQPRPSTHPVATYLHDRATSPHR